MKKFYEYLKESAVTEASEIKLSEVSPKDREKIEKILKILKCNLSHIFDGIHGMIVVCEPKQVISFARFEKDELKDLLAVGIRWIEANEKSETISVGF